MPALLRPFRPARGWLVLIGGSYSWPPTEAIDRAAIGRMTSRGPIAFVPAADCPPSYAKEFIETYTRLGAPDGYEVPIRDADAARDPENVDLLRSAALVYFGGGEPKSLLASMTGSPALDAIASAYEDGAVICGMSAGAMALAQWSVAPGPGMLDGWGWVPNSVVSVHHTSQRDALLHRAMRAHPGAIGVALPEHTALAFGPEGEVEQWGEPGIQIRAAAA